MKYLMLRATDVALGQPIVAVVAVNQSTVSAAELLWSLYEAHNLSEVRVFDSAIDFYDLEDVNCEALGDLEFVVLAGPIESTGAPLRAELLEMALDGPHCVHWRAVPKHGGDGDILITRSVELQTLRGVVGSHLQEV